MQIAQGIAMLSITAPVMGRTETVHPVLLWDDRDVMLVDTGYPRQIAQLRTAVSSLDVAFDRLSRIVMTHQDIDHIGNLQELVEGSVKPIEVSAHPLEKPYIQGERRLLRFTDEAIARVDLLPDHVPESFRKGLKALMLHPPRAPVDRIVVGGERLPWCGGIVVIDTPGHTPGHISLLHEPSRTLIAGDALMLRDGELCGDDPETTLDRTAALASLARLSSFAFDRIICYHGGLCTDRIAERLTVLAAGHLQH